MPTIKKKVCIVTSEIVGPFKNGGIGTHCYYLAQYLSHTDTIELTIVYNGAIENKDNKYWQQYFLEKLKAHFVWISPANTPTKVKAAIDSPWDEIAQANYDFLRQNQYDLVLFQEMLGGGFRAIQAKTNLGYFPNTLLAVMVHSSWQWINESMQLFPAYGLPEMLTKYMERYSVENCDVLLSPSQYMLDWTSTDVEKTPSHQQVLPYLFNKEVEPIEHSSVASELIFFGRLEQRKGLLLFLESLNAIIHNKKIDKPEQPIAVYFLGRAGQTQDGDGKISIEKYQMLLGSFFKLTIIDDLGHHEALDFLRNHSKALVVCPSLQDNSPFAIIENILLGTNLVSCRTGGIPELFLDDERLASPNSEDLSRLLLAGLSGNLKPVRAAYTVAKAEEAWGHFFSQVLTTKLSTIPAHLEEINKQIKSSVPSHALGVVVHSDAHVAAEHASINFDKVFSIDYNGTLTQLSSENQISHLVILSENFALTDQFETSVNRAIVEDPHSIWTCFTQIKHEQQALYAPLGPCLEAVLAANVLGTGVAIVPRTLLTDLTPDERLLLSQSLKDPSYFWSLLSALVLRKKPLKVIPEKLVFTESTLINFSQPNSIFTQRSTILKHMSAQLPSWTSRLLPYVVDFAPANNTANASTISIKNSFKMSLRRRLLKLTGKNIIR